MYRGRLFARLYDEASVPGIRGYPHREFAPGIVEMIALDLPDTVTVFSHNNANKFGGFEALRTQGIANLHGLEVEQLETLPAPGGVGLGCSCEPTAGRGSVLSRHESQPPGR
jgi:hypothetical protein